MIFDENALKALDKKLVEVREKIETQRNEIKRTVEEARGAYGAIIGSGASSFEALECVRAWASGEAGGVFVHKACGTELQLQLKDALEKLHVAHAAAAAEQQAAKQKGEADDAQDEMAIDGPSEAFLADAALLSAKLPDVKNAGQGDIDDHKRARDEFDKELWVLAKKHRK